MVCCYVLSIGHVSLEWCDVLPAELFLARDPVVMMVPSERTAVTLRTFSRMEPYLHRMG